MNRSLFRLATATVLMLSAGLALCQPSALTYQGQLRDGGVPVTGTINLEFRLYDQLTGGSQIGATQMRPSWPVEDGLFQVDLDFGGSAFNGAERYLEVRVNGSPLIPRQRVTATPYALLAGGLVGGVPETGWSLTGNAGTGPGNFLGTTDSQPLVFRVGNERAMQLGGNSIQSPNILAGSFANFISAGVDGATISGGGSFDVCSASGCPNGVSGDFGTVSGGEFNQAGRYAVVGGGQGNAAGTYAAVSGGLGNEASGTESTVGGGRGNLATVSLSTVAGGLSNTASGATSTIGGGNGNTASSFASSISGGFFNVASGESSFIGGGDSNIASGFASSIAGGFRNTAAGDYSFVAGRSAKNENAAHDGVFMFADSGSAEFSSTGPNQFLARASGGFGFNANSIPSGIEAVFQSRGGINVNTDLYLKPAAHGRGINLAMLPTAGAAEFRLAQFDGTTFTDRLFVFANGDFQVTAQASKPGGGSWAASSDRRLKSDIEPLTGALERMLSLAGVTFEYTDPDRALRPAGQHIGFIAQDVAEVFPAWVETDRDGYLTVGTRGFEALTVEAIRELRAEASELDQGQNRRLDQLEQENARLREQNDALEARLAKLEALLGGAP